MNSGQAEERRDSAQDSTARGWSPAWAVALAVLGVVISLVPLWYGLALLAEPRSTPDGQDDGFATAIAQVALLVSTVTLSLLGWFLVRGGKVSFWSGTALVTLALAWFAPLLLP